MLDTSATSQTNELFDQQLLAAWLNFANGAIEWNQLVDTNGDRTADTPFLTAMEAAERPAARPNHDANATGRDEEDRRELDELAVTSSSRPAGLHGGRAGQGCRVRLPSAWPISHVIAVISACISN